MLQLSLQGLKISNYRIVQGGIIKKIRERKVADFCFRTVGGIKKPN